MKTSVTAAMGHLSIRSDVYSELENQKSIENRKFQDESKKKAFKFLKQKLKPTREKTTTKNRTNSCQGLLDDQTEEMYDTQTSASSITNTVETDEEELTDPHFVLSNEKFGETIPQSDSSDIWFPAFGENTPPTSAKPTVLTSTKAKNNINGSHTKSCSTSRKKISNDELSNRSTALNHRGRIRSSKKSLRSVTDLKWECDSRNVQGKYKGEVLLTSNGPLAHGRGKLLLLNGDVYIGPFKNGMMHGSNAIYKSKLGGEYCGTYHDNFKHGFGEQLYISGHRYVGQYYDDLPNGVGVKYDENGGVIYHGEWVDGTPIQGREKKSSSGSIVAANGCLSLASSNGLRLVIPPNFQPSTRSLYGPDEKNAPVATDVFTRQAGIDTVSRTALNESRKYNKRRSDSSVATYEVSIYDPKCKRSMGLI
mmetsp:Transcript_17420/g.26354  ORF Transcript_17420/g.26354 Transcript_17420/m.26354 type:complete len:422 (+) Transcript_17420:178-1443(+)|eukprot:CAMPEP_0194259046 /NCGR_PEP_ID=MMETSP0158-20130606/42655_1 /TAXON_ID=33649 /ORGANISM="Thalassionema nitzschioides, Strain L26-B" /LENGTH=421 /DNA_ID=CAMNT_0038998673 /DNA_START=154 /DNA_END=1419 /DNA_ORIENTATION=+